MNARPGPAGSEPGGPRRPRSPGPLPPTPTASGGARIQLEFASETPVPALAIRTALGVPERERAASTAVEHLWVDTFDRRLRRAGLALQLTWGRNPAECRAEIEGAAGAPLWTVPCLLPRPPRDQPGWRLEQLLGAGPAAQRLGPLLAGRAFVPIAHLSTVRHTLALSDSRGRVVGQARWEQRSTSRGAVPRTLLWLTLAQGGPRTAARLRRRLDRVEGLEPGSGGWLAWLDPAPHPGPAPMTPEEPAAVAVRRIVEDLRRTATANVPGVLADLDPEFLHDLRVAVRRARSALKLLGDCLGGSGGARLALDLKWMGDLTTPTRDLDVFLQALATRPDPMAAPLVRHLSTRRAGAWSELSSQLVGPRWRTASRRWRAVGGGRGDGEPGRLPVAVVALERVGRTYRRAARLSRGLGPESPAEPFHRLRKRCKELRYLLEFFAPVLAGEEYRELLTVLRSLQDCLGEFQDTQVQEAALLEFAPEAAASGPEAVVALGRLDLELRERRRQAREAVTARLQAFTSRRLRRWASSAAGGTGR